MNQQGETEREHQHAVGQAALDWQRLHAWTLAQPEESVLGYSCTNTMDPLGAYLGAATHTRLEIWSIGPSIKTGYHTRLEKPAWVDDLLKETDRATDHKSGPITREMYLEILARVNPGGA